MFRLRAPGRRRAPCSPWQLAQNRVKQLLAAVVGERHGIESHGGAARPSERGGRGRGRQELAARTVRTLRLRMLSLASSGKRNRSGLMITRSHGSRSSTRAAVLPMNSRLKPRRATAPMTTKVRRRARRRRCCKHSCASPSNMCTLLSGHGMSIQETRSIASRCSWAIMCTHVGRQLEAERHRKRVQDVQHDRGRYAQLGCEIEDPIVERGRLVVLVDGIDRREHLRLRRRSSRSFTSSSGTGQSADQVPVGLFVRSVRCSTLWWCVSFATSHGEGGGLA